MSLAFNLFFWSDWLGTPAPAPPAPDTGSGGGKNKNKPPKAPRPYEPYVPDVEFWAAREQYLRSLIKEFEPEPGENPDELKDALERFNAERSQLIIEIRSAPSVNAMMEYGPRLNDLNSKISSIMGRLAVANLKQ